MVATTRQATASGIAKSFFGSPIKPVAQTVATAKVAVNVGGDGDCGFRALAAGIIDNMLLDQQMRKVLLRPRKNQKAISVLCEQYFKYFPEQNTPRALATPEERFMQLIRTKGMAEVVRKLAFVIRQVAVSEMVTYPEKYRGAYVSDSLTESYKGTSPAAMREPHTYIDETAIAAAAEALDLNVKVRVVAPGKELPLTLNYGAKEAKAQQVAIQLQNEHYIPEVVHVERFQNIANIPATAPLNAVMQEHHDPEQSVIMERIKQDDARIIAEYDKQEARLQIMLSLEEITMQELLDIYVKGLGTSDYLQGRIAHVGQENGNQVFFEAITRAQKGDKAISLTNETHKEQVQQALIHAIARAISIGQMPETVLDRKESISPTACN